MPIVSPFIGRPMPNSIPSNLSESIFRVYEPHIIRAITAYPTETEFGQELFLGIDGKRISGNTFTARFRDSLASVLRFGWSSVGLDAEGGKLREKLWSCAGQWTVSPDLTSGSVWFRTKQPHRRPTQYTAEARQVAAMVNPGAQSVGRGVSWVKWDETELRALVVLLSSGKLTGPYSLTGQVEAELVPTFEAAFNVSFSYDETANITTVL